MLQNMETITRVYYGDLYTDDGHYMETKSPYYDTIVNLMKSRIKYVSGGKHNVHTGCQLMVRWTIQMLNFTAQMKSTLQYVMVKTL